MSQQVDPRGQRFAAALTSGLVVAALLTLPGRVGLALLALQAALFAVAVRRGVHLTPVAALYRRAVRPRLGPTTQLEDPEPPRFAQGVGLVFVLAALVAFTSGADVIGFVAVGFALVAALLNATIGLCLGCEAYLLLRHLTTTKSDHQIPAREEARSTT